MATTNSNSTTPNQQNASSSGTPAKGDNSKQRIIAIAAVIILALLAVNIILLISYNNRGAKANELSAKLDEAEQLKAELDKQYYDALSELEELRGSNEELNALIDQQKEELTQQKDRIEKLLKDQRNIDSARKEVQRLTAQVEQYLAEINQLKAENEDLTNKTIFLSERNDSLSNNLSSQRRVNEELSTAQASLVSEKEALIRDREMLAKKVDIASVIKVSDIEVEGIKNRKSGKPVKKNNAKNVDQLQVCFTTTVNEVSDPGIEEFYVRIINPLGETLAIDELGSGVFTNSATGEQMRYTQIKEVEYDQNKGNYCMTWSPGVGFQEGNYDIEVYNKGFLAGSTSIVLK